MQVQKAVPKNVHPPPLVMATPLSKYPDAGQGAVCDCVLCTPQCVLQPPFFKHLIISPPIHGFWAAGTFGSSSCAWCSHVFGHRVSGIWGCGAFGVCCRVFFCCHRICHRVCCTPTQHIRIRWSEGARKTFGSAHFEEGQTAPCAEKNLQLHRGLKSTVSMVCMITTVGCTASHVEKRWMRHGRTHCRSTLLQVFMMLRVPKIFSLYFVFCR